MAFITAGDANVPPAGSAEKYLRACFLSQAEDGAGHMTVETGPVSHKALMGRA